MDEKIPAINIPGPKHRARALVLDYVRAHVDKTDNLEFSEDDIYIVWFCKVLQNWKALVSTTLPDGMYYEVSYNGDKAECYLDAYKKFQNVTYPDDLEREESWRR